MPKRFIADLLSVVNSFPWIKRADPQITGKVAKMRLWLNSEFIDVYYNAQTGSTSYAYIQGDQRLFGANNMKIGWHLHPFGQQDIHRPILPISIGEFLRLLEDELRQRGRL